MVRSLYQPSTRKAQNKTPPTTDLYHQRFRKALNGNPRYTPYKLHGRHKYIPPLPRRLHKRPKRNRPHIRSQHPHRPSKIPQPPPIHSVYRPPKSIRQCQSPTSLPQKRRPQILQVNRKYLHKLILTHQSGLQTRPDIHIKRGAATR